MIKTFIFFTILNLVREWVIYQENRD